MSDVIVDLVESGQTLKQNGLVEIETIDKITSVLIANKTSYKVNREQINKLFNKLNLDQEMTISKLTDDLKISSMKELISPSDLIRQLPMTDEAITTVIKTRSDIINILNGKDERLILVVGPCSIHDVDAAHEYAEKLLTIKKKGEKNILIIMRVYFEKPRTVIGWKGLINDPDLDNSFNINKGIKIARNYY